MRELIGRGQCWRFFILLLLASFVAPARAVVVGGGGNSRTDCLAVLSTAANSPASRPKHVTCTDGDGSCDVDGLVNGVCEVQVAVCANSTALSTCSLVGIDAVEVKHAEDDGVDPAFDPDFQALQARIDSQILDEIPNTNPDDCTASSRIRVAIKGPFDGKCKKGKKTLELVSETPILMGKSYTDKDKLKITCLPADESVNGCNAQTLFTGTFDRLQKQVFNQGCAVATCHDSNSTTGNLLLETGAAYTNLVNVDPTNPSALAQGWKRVTAADSDASFLLHKITGDLPDNTYGGRMPLGRRRLHSSLQTIIQLWIDAGAPPSGWVPGTF